MSGPRRLTVPGWIAVWSYHPAPRDITYGLGTPSELPVALYRVGPVLYLGLPDVLAEVLMGYVDDATGTDLLRALRRVAHALAAVGLPGLRVIAPSKHAVRALIHHLETPCLP